MSDRSTENGKTFSDPVENPSAFQVTIINFVSNFKQHTFNIFLNPYIVWHIDPTANMSLNHTTDGDSMSIQYAQTTTHQPWTDLYPMFSSSRLMDSKKKGLRISLAFFQRYYLLEGWINETIATVDELSDLWTTGAMDGVPVIVMNRSCL